MPHVQSQLEVDQVLVAAVRVVEDLRVLAAGKRIVKPEISGVGPDRPFVAGEQVRLVLGSVRCLVAGHRRIASREHGLFPELVELHECGVIQRVANAAGELLGEDMRHFQLQPLALGFAGIGHVRHGAAVAEQAGGGQLLLGPVDEVHRHVQGRATVVQRVLGTHLHVPGILLLGKQQRRIQQRVGIDEAGLVALGDRPVNHPAVRVFPVQRGSRRPALEGVLDQRQRGAGRGIVVADLVRGVAQFQRAGDGIGKVPCDGSEDGPVVGARLSLVHRAAVKPVFAKIAAALVQVNPAQQPGGGFQVSIDQQLGGPFTPVAYRNPIEGTAKRRRIRGNVDVIPIERIGAEIARIGPHGEAAQVPFQLRRGAPGFLVQADIVTKQLQVLFRAFQFGHFPAVILTRDFQETVVVGAVLQGHGGRAVIVLAVTQVETGHEAVRRPQFQGKVEVYRFLVANELIVERVAVETAVGVVANVGHVEGGSFRKGAARKETDFPFLMFRQAQRQLVLGLVAALLRDQVYRAGKRRATEKRGLRALDHFDPLDDIEWEREDGVVVQDAVDKDRSICAAQDLRLPADYRPAAAALHAVTVQLFEREAGRELADVHNVGQAPLGQFGRGERRYGERHVLDPFLLFARRNDHFLDLAHVLLRKGA